MEIRSPISLKEAAIGLKIIDGPYIQGALCDLSGRKSARGKLLMTLGINDHNLVEMDQQEATDILKKGIIGITDIQIGTIHYLEEHLPNRAPEYLTLSFVDALVRPRRFLGENSSLVLALDRLLHNYTPEQLELIPKIDWETWQIKAAISAAIFTATQACVKSESGSLHSIREAGLITMGHVSERLAEHQAATALAWGHWNDRIAEVSQRSIHTSSDAWVIGRMAAMESAIPFGENIQMIFANAVSELQGYKWYEELLKPTKENPKQPHHNPLFFPMFLTSTGETLTFKVLEELTSSAPH